MNKVLQKGKLVRDPEVKTVGTKNILLCKFTLAVPDRLDPKNKEKTYFAECVAWGKLAEIISKYCTKGQEILIVGRNAIEKWTKDGYEHKKTVIVCDEMEFCGGKPPQEQKPPEAPEPEPEIPW